MKLKIMKKFILTLAVVFAFLSANAQSKIIKTNPLGLAFGNINVTCERVLSGSSSILVRSEYAYNLLGTKVNLGGAGLGYRYYITHVKKAVPNGFYVNPEIMLMVGTANSEEQNYGLFVLGIGAELGYQWVWNSGFTLDLGIGPMYSFMKSDSSDLQKTGFFIPMATVAIGFAF